MMISGNWELSDQFQVRSAGFPSAWLAGFTGAHGDFQNKLSKERDHLRTVWSSPRLQEALVWQNPTVARNFLFPLLESEPKPDKSKTRRVERKLLLYLQRYCAKNEAIGFFGPIGWGRLDCELEAPREDDGPWLAERSIYFEPWLFHRLLEEYLGDSDFRRIQALTLSPRLSLESDVLLGERKSRRGDGSIKLDSNQLNLLREVSEGPRERAEL